MLSTPITRIEGDGRFLVSVLLSKTYAVKFRTYCSNNDLQYEYIEHGLFVRFRCAMTENELTETRKWSMFNIKSNF